MSPALAGGFVITGAQGSVVICYLPPVAHSLPHPLTLINPFQKSETFVWVEAQEEAREA